MINRKQEAVMKTKLTWFDRIMAAVTFAEANEPVEADHLLTGTKCESDKEEQCHERDVIITTDLQGIQAQ